MRRKLRALLPIAALLTATVLGGCVVYPDYGPGYRGYYGGGGGGWHHHHGYDRW
jgi:hypothetical protein